MVDFDVVVVGAGTAGCVLAARLTEDPDRHVCLLEAGPDYGPGVQAWPPDLLDARQITASHDWPREPTCASRRGRVVGGSSSRNACVASWGAPQDYDEWHPLSYSALEPVKAAVDRQFQLSSIREADLTPWHRDAMASFVVAGLPRLSSFNDLSRPTGIGPLVVNATSSGIRWNASLAYLDEARGRENLTVLQLVDVDRVSFDSNRVTGVHLLTGDVISSRAVVLASGTYGSPAILLRSGIGPRAELEALSIRCLADLPVGRNLVDHPGVAVEWEPTLGLCNEMAEWEECGVWPGTQVGARAASTTCDPGLWDLHIFPLLLRHPSGLPRPMAAVYLLRAEARGSVAISSADPCDPPVINHGFGVSKRDADVAAQGIELVRRAAEAAPASRLVGSEVTPGSHHTAEVGAGGWSSFFHPVGTCAIGSVVDEDAAVIGVNGLFVVDASVMPTSLRANTNMSTAMLAEFFAARWRSRAQV